MNVVMVTPMPVTSAIATVMMDAAEELDGHWNMEIWCPDLGSRFDTSVPVREFTSATRALAAELNEYSLVIYAIGDSPWHNEVLSLARVVPGLVVLHDVSVTNLVCAMHLARSEMNELVEYVRRHYGEADADELGAATLSVDNAQWTSLCQRVPLLDYALRGSLGVVVHSAWAASQVEGLSLGDVSVAPLPVPSGVFGDKPRGGRRRPRSYESLPADALVIVTVGAVNVNRRVDGILEAIASDEVLRRRAHLVAAGSVTDAMRHSLVELAASLGLDDRIHVPGTIEDDELLSLLERADICAALRDPVLEAKSASLLSQMQSGTPVLVLDHAHYAELPDDIVVKIPVDGGTAAIAAALRALVADPAAAAALGARGRDYVARTHTVQAYAAAIAGAGELALATRPLMNATRALSDRLRAVGLQADPVARQAVTETMFELFRLD